jgi:hypothetical protein
MISFKEYPLFVSVLGVCGLFALGEGWCIFDRWRAARDAAGQFENKRTELHAMGGLTPAPTRAVATAIEADLARLQRALGAMQDELKGRGPAAERLRATKVPVTRSDEYFDLATFVEKTRELAKTHQVELKPEAARFGFSLYANEGPEDDRIAPVFHQRLIAQYLVESLFDAKPRALLAMQREPPLTPKEKEERAAAPAAPPAGLPDNPDFFAIDPRASARVPGYVEATAFRLTFVGQTEALRDLLNKLASFELPVLVREVEVEPASSGDLATEVTAASDEPPPPPSAAPSIVLTTDSPAAKPGAQSTPKAPSVAPIVAKPWCKFTVTVEYIELVPAAGAVADAAGAPAKPTT